MKNLQLTEDEDLALRTTLLMKIKDDLRRRSNATLRMSIRENIALLRKLRAA